MAQPYVSPKIRLDQIKPDFKRADIQFHDIDHSGASFEARVFLNNPKANEKTAKTPARGYAGSFHIFGHGGCWGDPGHCEVREQRAYDPRPGHPMTPGRKTLIATEAIRRVLKKGEKGEVTITVVPVVTAATEKCDTEHVLHFKRLSIVSYA
jgi:hypothetical protein